MSGIPRGYKQTGVGVIPEEWEVMRLDASTEPQRPISYGIVQTGANLPNGVPCLRVVDINDGTIEKSDLIRTSKRVSDAYRRTILKPGDLVMPLRGKVGDIGIVDSELEGANLTRGVALLAVRKEHSAQYCRQFISWAATRKRLEQSMNGSALQEIPIATLRRFTIALPSSGIEQRAIAEALSDVDGLLGGLDRLIAKKRDLKQATLQQLLTGQTRLPGYRAEWPVKTFGQLFTFSGGHSASRDQLSTHGHCYLHYGDIHTSDRTVVDVSADYADIPKLDVPLSRVSPSALLDDGDVVFVDASEDDEGTSKHVVVVNRERRPFISGLHTIVAKPKADDLAHAYCRYCFQTQAIKDQFKFYAVGTKVSGISKGNIPKLTIPLPPKPEQTAIAEVLMAMDAELAALERRREKTRALKQAMMQELLTGRIRLV